MKIKSGKSIFFIVPLACCLLFSSINVKGSPVEPTEWASKISTRLEKTDDNYEFQMGDYNRDGVDDLYIIKKKASGATELHVLDGKSNYQTFILHKRLSIEETDENAAFRVGDYNGDGYDDLVYIKKKARGCTEAHVLSGKDEYQTFILHKRLPIEETDEYGEFQLGDYDKDGKADLFFLKKRAHGNTEVHVLSAASEYLDFKLHVKTSLEETDSNWELGIGSYNSDDIPDLYAIKKQGASGKTEVHVLDGSSGYTNYTLHLATVLEATDQNTKLIVGKGQFNIYVIRRQGATNTEVWKLVMSSVQDLKNTETELGFNINTALDRSNQDVDFAVGDFNNNTIPDVFTIKKRDAGRTTIHVLNGADRYQSHIFERVMPIGETDENSEFRVADYNNDGILDLYWIEKHAGGRTKVHILDGSDQFQSFLLETVLPIGETDLDSNFQVGDYNGDNRPDLYFIKKQAEGKTEVHILSGVSGYQDFILHKRTPLNSVGEDVEFGLSDYNGDGKLDLYCMNKQGVNGTELYILDGKAEYCSIMQKTGTALGKSDKNTSLQLVKGDKINIYAIKRDNSPKTLIQQIRYVGTGDGLQSKYPVNKLGELSAKYESNGKPGTISTGIGDIGGKSYGAWQLASNMGSVDKFISFLKTKNAFYYKELSSAKKADGNRFGSIFDDTWRYIAKTNEAGFLELQRIFIKSNYYDVSADMLLRKYNFDINQHSWALQNVLWSTAVQHGAGGAVNIFNTVGLDKNDRDLIIAIYDERSNVDKYFYSSSDAVKEAVKNRFRNEKIDALNML